MTCIVGFADGKKVWIGGDSAGVANNSLAVRADEKVFENGDFLLGFTSSFRMGQLLRYSFTPPYHEPRLDVDKYMRTVFVDAVRSVLKQGGFAKKENENESGGTFLVGYMGRLFEVESDYQVGERDDPFNAVGCGFEIALGAMAALHVEGSPFQPDVAILKALEISERFSAGVRRPFRLLSKTQGGGS